MDENCTIEDCGKKVVARGWCNTHYLRWRRYGDPLTTRHFSDPEEALAARVAWDGECLLWIGGVSGVGYGQIGVGGRQIGAHRFAFERDRGAIPEGMVVDHTCWNRACVYAPHLRAATARENLRSRAGANKGSALPRGVTRSGKKFRAAVQSDGKFHHVGTFSTPDEASVAAEAKRKELFGEFAGRA